MTRSTREGRRHVVRFSYAAVLAVLLLAGVVALGQPAMAAPAAGIDDVTYTGDGNVSVSKGGPVLWQSAPHEFEVAVSSPSAFEATTCLVANATERELGCGRATVAANTTESVTVRVGQWPANLTGEQQIRVVLHGSNESTVLDNQSFTVVVLQTGGDFDGDGLSNEREVSLGTAPHLADTDGDGLSDNAEVTSYESSPVRADSDGDGLSDGAEIERHWTDPAVADTDGDGLSDGREVELGTSPYNTDTDGDGLTDAIEVYTYGTDPTTADTDGDGLDDGAELNVYTTNPRQSDTDRDGLSDVLEANTFDTDPSDPDTDKDGLNDGAEVRTYNTEPTSADTDGDGLDDGAEVHVYETNPLNADTDGDGLADGAEVNRYGTDPGAIDTDGDGTSDRLEVETGLLPEVSRPVALAALVVVLGSVVVLSRARERLPGISAVSALGERLWLTAGGSATEPSDSDPDSDGAADAQPSAGRPADTAPESAAVAMDDGVPTDLLSNEERVLKVIDEHDGRVRQSEVVAETGWSKAKVSRVLSEMEDEGQVAKIHLGRENVVTRPDDVPSGASSPVES